MLAYLRSVIDSGTEASSHRFALVVAVLSLGAGTIGLVVAAICGQDVTAALVAVTVPLAGLAGHAYGKAKDKEIPQPGR